MLLGGEAKFSLKTQDSTLVVANDGSLQVHGVCVLPDKIGDKMFSVEVVVAYLTKMDGILGMDFVQKNKFSQNFFTGKLCFGDTEIPVHNKLDKNCSPLKLWETVTVNPGKGVIVQCALLLTLVKV